MTNPLMRSRVALGCLPGEVSCDDGGAHNLKSSVIWFYMVMRSSVVDDRFGLLPLIEGLKSFFLLFRGGSGGLQHLIVLRLVDAFFDEPFILTAPFVILVLVGTFRRLVPG